MKKLLATTLAVLALTVAGHAAIIVNNSEFFAAVGDHNYTLGTGSNQALVVAVGARAAAAGDFTISYNGQALTKAVQLRQSESGGSSTAGLYCLVNPTAGANTLSVTGPSAGSATYQIVAMTLNNVNTAAPLGQVGSTGDNSTPTDGTSAELTLDLNSLTSGSTVISAMQTNYMNDSDTFTSNGPSTNVSLILEPNAFSGNSYFGTGETNVDSASESLTWDIAGDFGARSALVGAEFVAVPEPGALVLVLGGLSVLLIKRRRAII